MVKGGNVFVLGNAAMDWGLSLPRMPAPGETLIGADAHGAPGGKGLNQAVVAARAGARVHLLAPLGMDAAAEEVVAALAQEQFSALHLPRLPGATDRSVLMLTPDGENCIVSSGECAAAMEPSIAADFARFVGERDVLLMQGNLSFAATQAALQVARGFVVLNTAPVCWDIRPLLSNCGLVVANAGEATAVAGAPSAAALVRLGAAGAIVTLGAAGCSVADRSAERHIPAAPAHLIDSTGAGDAFCGTLAALLADGWPMMDAVSAAQRVAAATVGRRGAFAALPSQPEMVALIAGETHTPMSPSRRGGWASCN